MKGFLLIITIPLFITLLPWYLHFCSYAIQLGKMKATKDFINQREQKQKERENGEEEK